eukprot:1874359-Pleurochrysis_carterae.AAC.8
MGCVARMMAQQHSSTSPARIHRRCVLVGGCNGHDAPAAQLTAVTAGVTPVGRKAAHADPRNAGRASCNQTS